MGKNNENPNLVCEKKKPNGGFLSHPHSHDRFLKYLKMAASHEKNISTEINKNFIS